MLVIGLTGSIATGKSTISSLLHAPPHHLPIIDADLLARKVVEPGTAGYAAIVKHFGPTTPDLLVPPSDSMPADGPSGHGRPLNRPALGRRVFGDTPAREGDRAVLNGIVHPAVRREMVKMLVGCYLRGCWAVVLDIPLLFESKLDRFCGTTLVVAVRDPDVQIARLMGRDGHLTREDAENRIKSQMDVRVKAERCLQRGDGHGVVLWNDGSRDDLAAGLDDAVGRLRRSSPDWWAWLLLACPPLALALSAWTIWRNVRMNARWEASQKEAKARL
ncbi:hypothetical protein E4U54_006183 [Claviceps lovelessii]|nr:hypothetical protein E4U54_006183 [Claviceps lovelessii]